MRVAYFSPAPDSRSGIADYSSLLLPALDRRVNVVVARPGRFRRPPNADVALYHVGNDPDAHGWIVKALRRRPGVVVVQLRLRHLVAGLTLARGDSVGYLDAMERGHGLAGRFSRTAFSTTGSLRSGRHVPTRSRSPGRSCGWRPVSSPTRGTSRTGSEKPASTDHLANPAPGLAESERGARGDRRHAARRLLRPSERGKADPSTPACVLALPASPSDASLVLVGRPSSGSEALRFRRAPAGSTSTSTRTGSGR